MNLQLRFGSVCSGIEAASVAWNSLGWKAAWLAEIEPFPSAVLAHHYPDVPNLGDMSLLPERILSGEVEAPDLFCGGTPCQAFSVAGLRKSLDDARGNLSLTFCEIADAIDTARTRANLEPGIVFWENVPGVLNTKDNAFGCFLAGLAGEDDPLVAPGGKWANAGCVFGPKRTVAWRVLDAQYFGVAQRRRRVFVVASARDGFDPAAVLLEFDGVRRDSAPRREAREAVAGGIEIGPGGGRLTDLNPTLDTRAKDGPIRNQLAGAVLQPYAVGNTLTARMHKGINTTLDEGQTPVLQPLAFPANLSGTQCVSSENLAPSMGAKNPTAVVHSVAFVDVGATLKGGSGARGYPDPSDGNGHNIVASHAAAFKYTMGAKAHGIGYADEQAPTLDTRPESNAVLQGMAVRRLTPVECERLQGFPDHYTAIPWRKKPASECPDGPRYKARGNSWAVPCVRWIGNRIAEELAYVRRVKELLL